MIVPSAQLRVFTPVESLSPRDRARWGPPAGVGLGLREAVDREAGAVRARLLTGRGGVADEAVLVRRAGSRVLVCPLRFDLRCGLALRRLREQLPDPVVDLLVPQQALRDHLDLVAASGRTPAVVDAPWAVPLSWFVLFTDDERHLVDPREGQGPRLTYLTTVRQAVARVDRAIDAIDDSVEDAEDILDDLGDLGGWLERFDQDAVLELDYGGLARLISGPELVADRSARDVGNILQHLEDGDMMAAVAYYGAVRGRWSSYRGLASAS